MTRVSCYDRFSGTFHAWVHGPWPLSHGFLCNSLTHSPAVATHSSLERLQVVSGNWLFSSFFCPALISVRKLIDEVAHDIGAPASTVSVKAPKMRDARTLTSFCIEDCQGTMLNNSYPSDCAHSFSDSYR